MSIFAVLWRIAGRWYVSLPLLAAVGVVVGYLVFFHVYPGKPEIGVIDIPSTLITENTAFVISSFLDHARRNDDIKAVVIRLSSRGGAPAPSEQLYMETRRLREKKPVVISMGDTVGSGAYMFALGANYTYAKASSIVGSVGVVLSFPGPLIPRTPDEQIVMTGPFKGSGASRRYWVGLADQLKRAFIQTVVAERGDRLRISPEELGQAQIYLGVEGVRLGLVDAIGSDSDAIEKAAALAGISGYELVDINEEIDRAFTRRLTAIFGSADIGGDAPGADDLRALLSGSVSPPAGLETQSRADRLRRLFLPSETDQVENGALRGLPLQLSSPNIYYLYVGPSP